MSSAVSIDFPGNSVILLELINSQRIGGWMKILKVFAVIFAGVMLAGCFTVPYSGRSQFILVSKTQEKELSQQAWDKVLKQNPESVESRYKETLERVGKKIAIASNCPDFNCEFKVLNSEKPNVLWLPDGKAAVTSGLFKFIDNDAELAAVLAHEAAHSAVRHGSERISKDMMSGKGSEALNKNDTGSRQLLDMYGSMTNSSSELSYPAEYEREADYIGLMYMAKAGYDPAAALTFWKKFEKAYPPAGYSHIPELERRLSEAESLYKQSKAEGGTAQSESVPKATVAEKTAVDGAALLEKARTALKAGNAEELKALLLSAEKNLNENPDDQKAWMLYGKLLTLMNNCQENNLFAEQVFAEAVRLDPQDDEARRYLADTYYRQGFFDAALGELELITSRGHFVDPETMGLLNMCYVADEQYGRGINFMGKLAAEYPAKDDIKLQIAILAHHWGNKPLAVEWLRKVIDNPSATASNRSMAEKLMYMNQEGGAQ